MTTYSPFFLTYGYHLNKGLEPKREYAVEAIGGFFQWINEAHETAKKALEWLNILMKNQSDKHKKLAIDYKSGNKVYISAEHQMEELSIRGSILGASDESNECTRSNWRIPLGTPRSTSMNLNHWGNKSRHSTKGAKETIWMAGQEVWARWSGMTGEGMGMMERQRICYDMGWRRWQWICEDTNLKEGVMLWVAITSLFFLSNQGHGWILIM